MAETISDKVMQYVYRERIYVIVHHQFCVPDGERLLIPALSDWYTGYVELFPDDRCAVSRDLTTDVCSIGAAVYGGITYDTVFYGSLPYLPNSSRYIGFDTNHYDQPDESVETMERHCKDLIDEVISNNE